MKPFFPYPPNCLSDFIQSMLPQPSSGITKLEELQAAMRSSITITDPPIQDFKRKVMKNDKKTRERKETVSIVQFPSQNKNLLQILSFPARFINPFNTFCLPDEIFINEEGIKASLGHIEENLLSLQLVSILSSVNLFKAVEEVIISKGETVCHVIFSDAKIQHSDWRYVVQRFESFGNQQFKQIADLIRQTYSQYEPSVSSKNFDFPEYNLTMSNHYSSFGSPSLKSETVISPQNYEYTTQLHSFQKKSLKGKHQCLSNLKAIENEILKGGKDALSYTFHYNSNKTLASMHFTKAFIERLGWEVSQFSMFCLYNGLPELLSYEEYYQTLSQSLADKLQNKISENPYSQTYLNKIGTKIETLSKKSAILVAGGVNITHSILNIRNDISSHRKIPSAPPVTEQQLSQYHFQYCYFNNKKQKVRGRKHFSQTEQTTLEYNLECPLNEMDRHQPKVCKYRVIQNESIVAAPIYHGSSC